LPSYSGEDSGRGDILVNDKVIATQKLTVKVQAVSLKRIRFPPTSLGPPETIVSRSVRFAKQWLAGGLYDVRLLKPGTPEVLPFN
jgi:hypothetical protein